MSDFSIKIDCLKLKGAILRNIKGVHSTKKCLIIPVEDCDGMFLGEKGCYLNLTAIAMKEPRFSDTHCIKVDISKERREQMTKEELDAVPILGGLHSFERQQPQMEVTKTLEQGNFEDEDDLPF